MKKIIRFFVFTALLVTLAAAPAAGAAAAEFPAAPQKAGWVQNDEGQWKYSADGAVWTSGWKKISGSWYWFDSDGVMATGFTQVGEGLYSCFGSSSGKMLSNCWAQDAEGQWYWIGSSGYAITGWKKISGSWYWFNSDGVMATGFTKVGEGLYSCFGSSSGKMLSNCWAQDAEGSWYWIGSNGYAITGWKKVSGVWYYFDPSTRQMVTGTRRIGDSLYLFSDGGRMQAGCWVSQTVTDETILVNDEPYTHTVWYYYGSSGARYSGWLKYNGYWYYFNPVTWDDNGALTDDGRMVVRDDNIPGSGFVYDGKVYQVDSAGRWCASLWVKVESAKVDEEIPEGGVPDDESDASFTTTDWYYYDSTGTMVTGGWLKIGSSWYYFGADGKMYANREEKIGRVVYTFDANGHYTTQSEAGDGATAAQDRLVAEALKYEGCSYVYGGTTPGGFDCSGFVQYVYKQCGYSISRVASTQNRDGTWVSRSELQPGDIIVFYNSSYTGIGHVGLYIGNNQFIHARNSRYGVCIDSLSASDDGGYWSSHYYSARRIVSG